MGKVTVEGPVGVDVSQVDTVPQFRIDSKVTQQEVDASNNQKVRTYRYCRTYDALAQGQAVRINPQAVQEQPCTVAGVAEAPVRVGVAQVAVSSPSGSAYTWLQTAGNFDYVKLLSACATNVELYVTTTDGALDDAAGKALEGIKNVESVATSATTKKCFSPLEIFVRTDA